MLKDIDQMVNNDWGSEMVDMKHDLRDLRTKTKYLKFTQKEAIEMSVAIGKIYSISHGITCVCGNKYRV